MNEIDHDGVVEDIKGNNLMVRIVTRSACASCQVKNLCNPSEMQEKVFEVPVSDPENFSNGDRVKMAITEGRGILAVFLGYIIPLILLLTGIIVATSIGCNELVSAGVAFGLMGLYYMVLYFTRKKTMTSFSFKVTRI